jgi:hypothetical protein
LPVSVAPALLLAMLLVLLGTQLAYVVAPRAPHYLVRLGLSLLALLAGEALGALGLGGHLAVGELHPINDLALLAALQWAGTRWIGRPRAI